MTNYSGPKRKKLISFYFGFNTNLKQHFCVLSSLTMQQMQLKHFRLSSIPCHCCVINYNIINYSCAEFDYCKCLKLIWSFQNCTLYSPFNNYLKCSFHLVPYGYSIYKNWEWFLETKVFVLLFVLWPCWPAPVNFFDLPQPWF